MTDTSEFFNQEVKIQEPAQLPTLGDVLANSFAAIPANAGDNLSAVLRLLQEGVATKPVWFTDPESTRAVVMIPLDITAFTPAMNAQLAALMKLNAERAPRG